MSAPIILYTDIISGTTIGGENGKGTYLSIFGKNFGSSGLGTTVKVYIGAFEVDNYRYLGTSMNGRSDIDQITVQVGALGDPVMGTPIPIRVSVGEIDSNIDHTFTPNPGRVLFVDNVNGVNATAEADDITKPWLTIQTSSSTTTSNDIYGKMQPGDTVVMRGQGTTYNTKGIQTSWLRTLHKGGSAPTGASGTGWINFMPYPGPEDGNAIETVNIVNDNSGAGGFAVINGADRSNPAYEDGSKYMSFSGLHMDGSAEGGVINIQVMWDNLRTVNNELTAANAASQAPKGGGVVGNGFVIFVYGNKIHNIAGTTGENHGVYIDGGGDAENTGSTDTGWNDIYDIKSGYGVQQYNVGTNGPSSVTNNFKVHHNWIHDSTGKAGINIVEGSGSGFDIWDNIISNMNWSGIRFNSSPTLTGCRVWNNTFYQNNKVGSGSNAEFQNDWNNMTSTHLTIRNNIVYARTGELYIGGQSFGTAIDTNVFYNGTGGTGSNPILGNPSMVDPANGDFSLPAGASNAKDAGLDTSALVLDDYSGNVTRPQNTTFDIGAYEYAVASTGSVGSSAGLSTVSGIYIPGSSVGSAAGSSVVTAVSGSLLTAWKAIEHISLSIPDGSILDLSSLVATGPAGINGRVIINSDGRMAFTNQPTEAVRFLCASQPLGPVWLDYPSHSYIDDYVHQLRVHGYNMARFHLLRDKLMQGATADFDYNETELDAMFYLMSKLKAEGIYLMIDAVTESEGMYDNTAGHDVKLGVYYDATEQQHWKDVVDTLWNIENPYTGLTTLEDPFLLGIDLFNEGGLRFAIRLKAAAPQGLEDLFVTWLIAKYGNTTAMCAAWGDCTDDNLETGNVNMPIADDDLETPRVADMLRFYTDTEADTVDWMTAYLASLGYTGLITSMNNESSHFQCQASRSHLTWVDMHRYWDAYDLTATHSNTSSLTNDANWVQRLALARYMDKPYSVSEHGHTFWNQWRHEAGLTVGGYAAFQGWDMLCEHGQGPIELAYGDRVTYWKEQLLPFALGLDPIRRVNQTLHALLFLRGDVTESSQRVVVELSPTYVFDTNFGQSGLSEENHRLALLHKVGLHWSEDPTVPSDLEITAGDLDADPTPWATRVTQLRTAGILPASPANVTDTDGTIFQSDTDEIFLYTSTKQIHIITPKTEAISFDTGAAIALDKLEIVSTSVPGMVSVSAMDGSTLENSSKILLMLATDAQNTGMTFEEQTEKNLVELGTLPVVLNTISIVLNFTHTNAAGFRLYALALDGTRSEEISIQYQDGIIVMPIDTSTLQNGPTTFFELGLLSNQPKNGCGYSVAYGDF